MEIANRKTAIMLVSMVSLSLIQSTTAAAAQKLSTQEHAYLEQLIDNASAQTVAISKQLHAFFDTTNNKESYRTHVQKFFKILQSVDGTIVIPLEDAIKATSNAEYKALLAQMYSIIMDLRKNLVDAHQTLESNTGGLSFMIAKALGGLKDRISSRVPNIEKQLILLHAQLKTFDPGLAQKLINLQKTIDLDLDLKPTQVVALMNKRCSFK